MTSCPCAWPVIFISTLITHLFGGSAGREGAALQMGGSIGNAIGKFFRFDDKDKHVMIMCGMSAAFSALFGTPMAAAILSNGNCASASCTIPPLFHV